MKLVSCFWFNYGIIFQNNILKCFEEKFNCWRQVRIKKWLVLAQKWRETNKKWILSVPFSSYNCTIKKKIQKIFCLNLSYHPIIISTSFSFVAHITFQLIIFSKLKNLNSLQKCPLSKFIQLHLRLVHVHLNDWDETGVNKLT